MDPNAALTEIRSILARNDLELPDYERLAELTEALDKWLSNGGFLPDAWQNAGR